MPSKVRRTKCPWCDHPVYVVNGAWLRARRKQYRISLRAFARQVDLSAPYIGDIELNRRGCSHEIQMAYERLPKRTDLAGKLVPSHR